MLIYLWKSKRKGKERKKPEHPNKADGKRSTCRQLPDVSVVRAGDRGMHGWPSKRSVRLVIFYFVIRRHITMYVRHVLGVWKNTCAAADSGKTKRKGNQ